MRVNETPVPPRWSACSSSDFQSFSTAFRLPSEVFPGDGIRPQIRLTSSEVSFTDEFRPIAFNATA
jgi:hypothetical protein